MRYSSMACAVLLLVAGAAQAEDVICKGSITSVQGEGLVARSHRFEVFDLAGSDLVAVLEQCRTIAQEKQNRAARKSPGGAFRKVSQIDLECSKGGEKFQVRRSIQTGP